MKCTQSHASIHLREQILGVFDKCLHPHRGTALKETLGISSLQRFQPALSLPAQQPCGESTSYARVWRFTGHRLRPARPPPPLSVRPSLGVGGGVSGSEEGAGSGDSPLFTGRPLGSGGGPTAHQVPGLELIDQPGPAQPWGTGWRQWKERCEGGAQARTCRRGLGLETM